jgi:tetratricopeptide (TPR) repeat protein
MNNDPDPQEIEALLALFTQGRYQQAATLAESMTQRFPLHGFAWKVWGVALQQLGHGEKALLALQKAAALMPADAHAQMNLAVALQVRGQAIEAEASFRRALEIEPDFAEANYCLGNTLRDLERLDEAQSCYRRALQIKPDFADACDNLGFILQKMGRPEEAQASYRQALRINPMRPESSYNLGNTLRDSGQLDEAEACYRQALQNKPDFAEAYGNLGFVLQKLGRLEEALSNYRQALMISPTLLVALLGLNTTLSRIVPHWHVPMMNDQKRNQAYHSALEAAITPLSEVFEIGTGSGLLAMMAAKLGARRVTSCEAVPLIAHTAQRIIADNGYEASIKILSMPSTEVDADRDLAGKADILLAEIFSSELLGEHVLPSIEDAKRRLLKPRGRVIPAAASIMVALFSGSDLSRNVVVEDSFGFNLQRFNTIISNKQAIARNDLDAALLTDAIEGFRFDFQNESFFPEQTRRLRLSVKAAGRCYGIVQWIRLQMDQNTRFENHPSDPSPVSNWQHCTYVFAQPMDLRPGQTVLLSAKHNRIVPWFTLDAIE